MTRHSVGAAVDRESRRRDCSPVRWIAASACFDLRKQ